MSKHSSLVIVGLGLALTAIAIPGWAAPPVESEVYLYGEAECPTGLAFSENVPLWTGASFTATNDGDNDINVGDALTTSLRLEHLGPISVVPFGTGHVDFTVLGTSVSENFVPFEVPQGAIGTVAENVTTIPAAAQGTIVTVRVDGFTDDLYPGILEPTTCFTNDGEGSVDIYVNKPPVLVADAAVTEQETPTSIDVLANDATTWDSGTITTANPTLAEAQLVQDDVPWDDVPDSERAAAVTVASNAANGTAVVESDGTITYTPDPGFVGMDAFTYQVTDNDGATATAAVTIDVTDTDSALETIILTPSSLSVDEGGTVTFEVEGFTAGGDSLGDVTDEVSLSSDHPSDVIHGNTVSFPTASPHIITATHSSGALDSVTIEVIASAGGVTPDGAGADNSGKPVGITSTGGEITSAWLLAGFLVLAAGAGLLLKDRFLRH